MGNVILDLSKKKIISWISRGDMILVIIVNTILIISLVLTLVFYFVDIEQTSMNRNVERIEDIAIAKSGLAEKVLYASSQLIIENANLSKGKTVEEAMGLLSVIIGDTDKEYQLISKHILTDEVVKYEGFSSKKDASEQYFTVSYSDENYGLVRSLENFNRSKETGLVTAFTNPVSNVNCYATFSPVDLKVSGIDTEFFLLYPRPCSGLIDELSIESTYSNVSTAIIDSKGDYLIAENSLDGMNFYDLLIENNDLSLEKKDEIQKEVTSSEEKSGSLFFLDGKKNPTTYAYTKCDTELDWYVIVAILESEYYSSSLFSIEPFVVIFILLAIFFFDITQLMMINKRLRVSMDNEKKANDAKTDFLSRMSHDIRTPLNGIIGLTSLAMDEDNPPRTRNYLENINVSGCFLTGLVNDILDMSRVESGKVQLHLEPCTTTEFVKYIEAVIIPLSESKGIKLNIDVNESPSPVLLDRLRFNQIIFNLLSNAIKYTPPGGIVDFILKRANVSTKRASIDLTVRDNGIGMSEEFQRHMFEPFTQENIPQTSVTGAGLGLSIVINLVRFMGGSIEVDSKLNVGSTFKVHIETAIYFDIHGVARQDSIISLVGKQVLVCEDNHINILVVQRLLEKWGVIATIAENGQIGVDKFIESSVGYYDAIIMDMMMPVMDGLKATRKIRTLKRADAKIVPIIAMTANAYDVDVKKCLDAGMDRHVGKPVDPEELKSILSREIFNRMNKSTK